MDARPEGRASKWVCAVAALSILAASRTFAGPVEFGVAEYNAALASRNLKWKVKYELTVDPPETYHIEPYKFGGAHITGGDLRGLMYGLLDAAEQIRATGHLKQTQSAPVIHIRGARMFVRAADLESFDWLDYFNILARDRFNHFTLVFLDAPYASAAKLASISQLAAEFGIDFTLGIWEHQPSAPGQAMREDLSAMLTACPLIRTVQWRTDSAGLDSYRDFILTPLHEIGRRVALEPLGSLAAPEFLEAAQKTGVALYREPVVSPPGFHVDLPRKFQNHALLYWMWGTLAYDPQARAIHGGSAAELAASAYVIRLLAQALVADPDAYTSPEANAASAFVPVHASNVSDWIATVPEAVEDRLHHAASAKSTPLEIADALLAAAGPLDSSPMPDIQLLARLARYQAHSLRARNALELFGETGDSASLEEARRNFKSAQSYMDLSAAQIGLDRIGALAKEPGTMEEIPPPVRPAPRPSITHSPVRSAPAGQPVNVSIAISPLKEIRAVRLHYRAASAPGVSNVIEKPAAASLTFTIPPADTNTIYFFEILTRDGGWFEPDPFSKTPYYVIKAEIK
ncbi:MAG TPA: hypothetical protein VMG40_20170 [Bryobacteraceae bacterium]|nr:hypothetical protein [Bryobacteraceae bacterium]